MRNSILRQCIFALILLASVSSAFGQEFRGSITGQVVDPNGAAMPGATVNVRNLETNVTSASVTNDEGTYSFLFLLPGKYSVTVKSNGFKTVVREGIEINVDARLTVDFQLEIGTEAEVNVIAGTEVVERGSVTTGTVISNRQVQELPLPEGAVFTLVTQTPGVAYTGNPQFTGPTANGNLASFRSNGAGGVSGSNQINLDGSPNLAFSGQVAFTPPSDAVQEFKVQTNNFDSQIGYTAGATVNVALKSGTNRLHGAINYFNRDKSRTANNFFNNRARIERPDRKYYRYGIELDGPVYIPKIYNGKDRTFFLFAYEKQRDNLAEPTLFFTPTERQRNGDFSEIGSTLIYDPATAFAGTGTGAGGNGCATGAVCRRAFAGNRIPTNRLNPIALAYLRLYPLPNQPVTDGVGRFFSNMNLIRPYKSYLGRIDHTINQDHRIFGKYYYSKSDEDRYNWLGQPDSITRGFEFRTNIGGNINYTATLSPSLIFDVRASYNVFKQERVPANPLPPSALGFSPQALASFRGALVIPRFDFRSFRDVGQNTLGSFRSDYNEGLTRSFNMYSLQPTFTQIFENHTFRYGYDLRLPQEKNNTLGYNTGRFLFDGTYTSNASNANAAARDAYGRDLAAFLLGIPTASTTQSLIDNPSGYRVRSTYHGFFFQDDWRISPNLTLNLGLRYEYELGVTEADNRIIRGFDTTTPNPIQASALANFNASPPPLVPRDQFSVLGGLIFSDNNNRANQEPDNNNFQPRFGLAYSINDKTVFRFGFGIFSAPFQIQAVNQSGFSTPTVFVPTTDNGLNFLSNLSNPFPSGVAPSPGSTQGLFTFAGRDLGTILSTERKNAQYGRFILGVQRELPFGFGLDVNFVHSHGYDLAVVRDLNFIPRQFLNSGPQFDQTTQNFLNATVSNPFRGLIPGTTYNGATIQRRFLLVPFPQFGNVAVTEYDGNSIYNAIQFQVIKRFTKGLSFNASYTYSDERERTQRLNPQDEELVKQISPNDRPHRFTFSTVYELPIGRGQWVGKDWNRWVNAFLGGWQFQANYEWQSGEPILLGNFSYTGDPFSLVNRGGEKDEQGRRYGIDIPAFDVNGFGGNLGNNRQIGSANTLRYLPFALDNFRHQRFLNFNLGFSKNFRIKEGMKLQLRFEAINALNSPYFFSGSLGLDPTQPANLADPANQNNLGRFGYYNGPTRQPPRDIQIGARFTF